jgi:hypothetical protein
MIIKITGGNWIHLHGSLTNKKIKVRKSDIGINVKNQIKTYVGKGWVWSTLRKTNAE